MENNLICLDTSILIDYYRKKDKQRTLLYKLSVDNSLFAVSSITVFEIFVGSDYLQNDFWTEFFQSKFIIPFEDSTARLAADIDKTLKKQRKRIDIPDLFIAASALEHNLPLATINVKHFERVSGLQILTKS